MSESMIERVARAICCPDGCAGDTGSGQPCNIRSEDSTSMIQARAAIQAMRSPTLEMRKVCSFTAAEIDYPAMISAALKD